VVKLMTIMTRYLELLVAIVVINQTVLAQVMVLKVLVLNLR